MEGGIYYRSLQKTEYYLDDNYILPDLGKSPVDDHKSKDDKGLRPSWLL